MDEKMKQMVRENLEKMNKKWEKKMEGEKMDDKRMDEMMEKAIKLADDLGMDAKGTMKMGKMLKMVGMAMIEDSDMKEGEW